MPLFVAPHDCDLPLLGLSVQAGQVVDFPDGNPPGDWKPKTAPKGAKTTPQEG